MPDFTVEFEGGLGDFFLQCYRGEGYTRLCNMGEGDAACVEMYGQMRNESLFANHPYRDKISFATMPHRPNSGWSDRLRNVADKKIEFFPTDFDRELLRHLKPEEHPGDICIIVPDAGSRDRDLPVWVVEAVKVMAARQFKYVATITEATGLTCAGYAWLLQRVGMVVCGHSSANILRFSERLPQVCLYPQHVEQGHVKNRDIWGQFADAPEAIHGPFSQWEFVLEKAFGSPVNDTWEAYKRMAEMYDLLQKRVRRLEEIQQGR